MKISVIGTGYVGLTITCLADFGHKIILIGRAQDKIDLINKGIPPIFEPSLDEIIKRNIENKNLKATNNYNEILDSDVVFICVGTPSKEDGSIDLSQIESSSTTIGEKLKDTSKYIVVTVKSTVSPNTTKNFVIPILEKFSGKKAGRDFGVCMNPEFLREGNGVSDFIYPDKIVIGGLDEKSRNILVDLYKCLNQKYPRVLTDLTTAEMVKYSQNSALALRVSFINEIANICEKFGVDVYEVAKTIGMDSRIGPKFLNAGVGFGGSCFPKDVKGLVAASESVGIQPKILKSVLEVNETQPYRAVELAKEILNDLNGKNISVLGLAFKPDTDDMRESRTIPIIKSLISHGARVRAYDPQAIKNTKEIFGDSIEYCSTKEECLKDADLCMVLTEWDEFRNMDLSIVKCPIVDGRRAIDPIKAKNFGIIYKGIGWGGN